MKRSVTKLFVRTPDGQKTPQMLEVERRLGRSLEDDFREYYVEKGWGQTRIAKRWGVRRNTIFYSAARDGSRCWVDMLGLPMERSSTEPSVIDRRLECEVCKEHGEHFDAAHWISASTGGSTESFNILRLCPNCHRKLDRDDPAITEQAKETLLFRELRRILESNRDSEAKRKELVRVCESIITRKVAR